MIVDDINITFAAGDGGGGKVHFYTMRKGPDGGNGGKGGDIYLQGTTDLTALRQFSGKVAMSATPGENGGSNKKTGHDGTDKTYKIPVGSEITDLDTSETFVVKSSDYRILFCRGGSGGRGNFEFRSSILTTPRIAEPGALGQIRRVRIDMKHIADIGIIGLPNAGKSSLLNALTRANVKTGSYPFTTLEANLGVFDEVILADIPGLIEGASMGKGLGTRFLKHIEKVKLFFHCVALDSTDPIADYQAIRTELGAYNPTLLEKPEIILLTKTDLVDAKEIKAKEKLFKKYKKEILTISIIDDAALTKVKNSIHQIIIK